ncbi:hypothetical protein GQE99_09330 [Maritimibacter sp. DP07]|uniref:Cache domain-containing protein n=1 Tax=Maritimibacter harenae TaxID=2606218 RepID=A0A845M486_9RHOB|nr:hypothetical protein [Maritimibacter harenae]MZR13218.1 hypothetical protein [Maritimibacter harenae]
MKTLLASTLILGLAAPATAQDFAAAMGDFLDQHVVGWASDPVLLDAIRDKNAAHEWIDQSRIDALDRAWQDEIGRSVTPTISTVMENPASDFLRARVNALGGAVTEVFVVDAHGLNVAASAPTSDYWQGDEAKFTETFAVGPRARHFSEIERDASTSTYQGQASFTIVDPETGAPIGAMTVGINAEALF